tara:strand:+ start:1339 stop:1665 length:327 start_codon:yes stop_codon:yes gene_type:complete
MNKLTSRIVEIMKNKNISASDLSKQINVQKSSISHILNGRNKPSLDFIIKLTSAFDDLSIDWLINGDSAPSNQINTVNRLKKTQSIKKVNKIILFYDDNSFETYEKKL